MLLIRKNGGDDPDSTHGAVLCAKLIPSGKEPDPRGYALSIGRGTLLLESLGGIGLCTREGLDCDPGHWAFNISVRRMIVRNLERLDFGKEPIRLTARVGVENGENLAKTTLNPALGIRGGISILGTTGLVRPFSHDAYIASIRLCVRSLAFSGGDTMFFCTGGRSEKAARLWTREGAGRKIFGSQPDEAFTSIADFIGESVRAAEEYGMRRAVICCMPGKLLKYACGLFNTHAHRTAQDIPRLAERLGLLGADKELVRKTAACATVREALGFCRKNSLPRFSVISRVSPSPPSAACCGSRPLRTRPRSGYFCSRFPEPFTAGTRRKEKFYEKSAIRRTPGRPLLRPHAQPGDRGAGETGRTHLRLKTPPRRSARRWRGSCAPHHHPASRRGRH